MRREPSIDREQMSLAFAERLEVLMKEKDIPIKELSISVGVSDRCIAGYLHHRNVPQSDILCHIAEYLDVTMEYLLGRESK